MNNKVLLVWSGGCDSTLALTQLLQDKKEVRTISIKHAQIGASKENSAARLSITRKLVEKGYKINNIGEVEINDRGLYIEIPKEGIIQPVIWIGIAAAYLQPDEDLAFGYIRTDDFWHYKTEFEYIFTYLTKMMSKSSSNLLFPVQWFEKTEVIKALREWDLLNLCWTCESPTYDGLSCGTCIPCTHMLNACKIINIEFPFPLYVRKKSVDDEIKANIIEKSIDRGDKLFEKEVIIPVKIIENIEPKYLLSKTEKLNITKKLVRNL